MNKQIAEFIGTFALVFFGCGAALVAWERARQPSIFSA
jgi:glycerol uptake facilitator-like aquaporin